MDTSPKLIITLLILGIMQISDIITTHIALSLGAIECNTLMSAIVLKPLGLMLKIMWYVFFTLVTYIAWSHFKVSSVRKAIHGICLSIVIAYLIVNLNNILVILTLSN